MRERLVKSTEVSAVDIDSSELPKALAKASVDLASVLQTMGNEVAQSGFCAQSLHDQEMEQKAANQTLIASAA